MIGLTARESDVPIRSFLAYPLTFLGFLVVFQVSSAPNPRTRKVFVNTSTKYGLRFWALVALLSSAFFCLGAPAMGQPRRRRHPEPTPVQRAQALHEQGLRAYRAGQWEAASNFYVQAYALSPDCEIVFNLARSYEQGGRFQEALESFRRLATDAACVTIAGQIRSPDLPSRIATLEARLRPVVVTPPVPTPVVEPVVTPPVLPPTPVVVVRPVVTPHPLVPPRVYRRERRLIGLPIGLGAFGAAALGFGVYGFVASAHDRALSEDPATVDPGRYARAADSGFAWGIASTTVGIASGLGAAALYLWGPSQRVLVTPTANGATATVRF